MNFEFRNLQKIISKYDNDIIYFKILYNYIIYYNYKFNFIIMSIIIKYNIYQNKHIIQADILIYIIYDT